MAYSLLILKGCRRWCGNHMAGDKTQFDPTLGSSFEDYDLSYTPDELEYITFDDGLDDYEQAIIRAYNEGLYGPVKAPEDWPKNFRNQSVLTRSIPISSDIQNTPENKNAQLIASYQDKLNQIFELACQLPNSPVAGMSYGNADSDFIPLECQGNVDDQTRARLQDFEQFFAHGLDITTRWGIGFTREAQKEIDTVLAAVNGEAWDYEYHQEVEGGSQWDEDLVSYDPENEAPVVGSLDPAVEGSSFSSGGLFYAAQHSGELKLLGVEPNAKDPQAQCSNYARKLVQHVSTIPYDLFQDAWNVRQYLAPYTIDRSDISMRDFYRGLPGNVDQGPEYQAALERFYAAALAEPFSIMTLFYEGTQSRGAATRKSSSDSVSHIGMSLGGITSTETVNGNQSLAKALIQHYGIQPGLEFLLVNIEVSYQGQKVYYDQVSHEFINDAGDIIQLGEGNQAIQVTDVRLAHQVGNYQGFVSLIALLGTGRYHPTDLMSIQNGYLLPEYQDLKSRIQAENGTSRPLVSSSSDFIPVTDTFYVNPGENLSALLQAKGITGEKYSLFQLYCADQMGIFINQLFSNRQQFSIPDFEAYKTNLDSRGGKQAVAASLAAKAYPADQYATFVVSAGQDPYDLLGSWFGSDFVFGLTPQIKDQLIGAIFDYNNYFVGQWPNRDAADWGAGMIFAMSHEDVAQYKDWAKNVNRSYQAGISTSSVTVTVKGQPLTLDSSLVSSAQAATSDYGEQAELLALHLIEKGQGGRKAWVEDILQSSDWTKGYVTTTGAIETNIAMYARERGMTVDEARAELRSDPTASIRFASWLLGNYKRDVNRVAAGFERKYGVTLSPEQKSMAALDAFNAGGIKRAQFMGFQYMVGNLLQDHGVHLSNYKVDGYAGTEMGMAVRALQNILGDVSGVDWNGVIAQLSRGEEITSGPLYDAVVQANIAVGHKPLLFLGVEEYHYPWVKTNYGLNTYRYAQDVEAQLRQAQLIS